MKNIYFHFLFLNAPYCRRQQVHNSTKPRMALLHLFPDFVACGISSCAVGISARKTLLRHLNGRFFFTCDKDNSNAIASKLNPTLSILTSTCLCNFRTSTRTCCIFLLVSFWKAIKTNPGFNGFRCRLENNSRNLFFSSSPKSKKKILNIDVARIP